MALDNVLPIGGNISVNAAEFRRLDVGSTMVHDTHPLACRPGVTSGMTPSLNGGQIRVSSGTAIVTPVASNNGSYRVANVDDVSLPLYAKDTSYPRTDILVLKVYDGTVDGSNQYKAAFEMIKGVASASSPQPATPAGALLIARVIVSNTGSPTIYDARQYTCAVGGTIPCYSDSRPTTWFLQTGQRIFELDTNKVMLWTGRTWREDTVIPQVTLPRIPAIASGTVTSSSAGPAVFTIQFPPGRFSSAPRVVASVRSASGDFTWDTPKPYNVTATQFQMFVKNGRGCDFDWIAIENG